MNFVHFGRRMKIEELFYEWCEAEGIAKKPNSMVVFLMEKGWLNEEQIIKDLAELRSKDEPQKHCHRPSDVACHPEQGDMWCRGCDYWYANESQTERPTRCSECKVWRRCFKEKPSYNMIKSRCPIDEPQTERSE